MAIKYGNKPFSYSRYIKGKALGTRLAPEANAGSSFKANYSGNFFFNDFPTHARSLQASSSPIRRITKWFILNEVMRKLQSELDEPSECTPLETIFLLFKSATVAPWAEILRSALGRFLHDVPSPHNRTGGK